MIERTEGNPFFLEESVRSLIETQAVTGEPGDYRLTRVVRDIEVPAAVEALLAARIDRLLPDDRQVLQSAAVIGTDVPLGLLSAIESGSEDALGESVTRLQAAEFLYEKAGAAEPEYTFKHALTHEVAYGSLPAERRRGLHARIVAALEACRPDQPGEPPERLAITPSGASSGTRPWCTSARRARRPRAFRLSRSGHGVRAGARGARPPARVSRDDRAVRRPATGAAPRASAAPRGRPNPGPSPASRGSGRSSSAIAARLGRVLSGLCNTWWTRGDHARAVALGTRALEIGNALGDVALRPEATIRLGAVHYTLGSYSTAVSLLRQSLDLMRARPESERLGIVGLASVMANTWLSRALSELGQFAEAKARADEGFRVASTADQPFSLIGAHVALGILGLHQGHFDRAAAAFRSAVELWHARGTFPPGWRATPGWPAPWLSRVSAVKPSERWRKSSTTVRGTGVWSILARRAAWLGEAARWCGRSQEAGRHADEALRLARAHKERGERGVGPAPSRGSRVGSRATRPFRCRGTLPRRPRPGRRRSRCAPSPPTAIVGWACCTDARGRGRSPGSELAVARELYRDMGMTFWLERADAELAAMA